MLTYNINKINKTKIDIMNWTTVSNQMPPKRDKPYQVLVMSKKRYGEGRYEGQQTKTIVQDWVIRERAESFTHWIEIVEPS